MLKIGHRGAKAYEPENTIRSFRAGIKKGANAIEFDVRVSKDGTPVIMHDSTLERTTNGKGKVSEKSLKSLRALDAGKGEKIPTLREALNFIKKQATPVVEIKDAKRVKKIIDVVKKSGKKSIVIGYDTKAVRQVKEIDKNLTTGLIFKNKIKNITGFMKLGKVIKADWLFGRADIVDKKFLETAHKWKFKVLVWVVNTKKDVAKWKKIGVDGIASDKPDVFK